MLWYKAWLDSRWRFLIGLILLTCSAVGTVLVYPRVMSLMPMVNVNSVGGEIGRQIREAVELSKDFRGYIWSQAFRKNLAQMATFFAVLLGTGGLLSQAGEGAALFTLSLPISRGRLFGVRAAAGLSELLLLALVPSILIPVFSPAVGESYSLSAALVHGICLFVGGAVFFSLALMLSTVFNDVWRPLLLALSIAIALAVGEQLVDGLSAYSVFGAMTGETYYRSGQLPWVGLMVSIVAAAGMLAVAAANTARRDF
jgi:ABC-type transport system involved in multi-copper enzyme maturation permease subunit